MADETYLDEPGIDEEEPGEVREEPARAVTFSDEDAEDGYFPPGTILEEDQPPCVKFEINRAIEKGIDLQPFAGLTDMQLRQVRLAYEHGVGDELAAFIKRGDDPNPFNHIQMEIIRLGLEQKLDVSLYAQERFNVNQMWELFLTEQEGLPAKRLATVDPRRFPKFSGDYTDEQMRELRLALEEDADLHKLDNPELSPDEMHSRRLDVGSMRLRSPIRAAMDAYSRAKRRRKLEKQQSKESRQTPDEEGGES